MPTLDQTTVSPGYRALVEATGVAEAQQVWRFANPGAGKSVDDLPADVPLLVVRAGRDAFPQINPSIDAFVRHGLRRNLPLTLVNHHRAPHAFDVDDDSEESQRVIMQILAFLRMSLAPTCSSSAPSRRTIGALNARRA